MLSNPRFGQQKAYKTRSLPTPLIELTLIIIMAGIPHIISALSNLYKDGKLSAEGFQADVRRFLALDLGAHNSW